jgi:trk system potassium uptake protein TrkA
MSLGDMMTLLKLRRGDYSLVEEKLVEGSGATGIPLRDLALPGNCVIAAIIRHGKIVVPNGDTAFEPGDEVLAVTDRKCAEQLLELFNKKHK